MEIKYVWIEEYKNLKKIGLNFNHSLDEEFTFLNGKLDIKKSSVTSLENFFGPNIKGLTAIVGKNGSGKTNVTEFLNYNLAHATNHGLSTYIKGNGLIVVDKYVLVQEEIKIELSKKLQSDGYKVMKFKNAPLDKGPGEIHWSIFEKNKYIYYNPIFDFRVLSMDNNWDNIQNISTSYLAWNDIKLSNKHHIDINTNFKKGPTTDLLYAHVRNEKLRESDFILNYPKTARFIGEVPPKIEITLDYPKENRMLIIPYYSDDELESQHLNEPRNELDSAMSYLLQISLLDEYVTEKKSSTISVYQFPVKIRKQYFERLFWVGFFRIYQNFKKTTLPKDFMRKFIFEESFVLESSEVYKFKELRKTLKQFLDECEFLLKDEFTLNNTYKYDDETSDIIDCLGNVSFEIGNEGKKSLLIKLIKQTSDILNSEIPFHYEFKQKFSSGQQKLLNFYSRFYWASKELSRNEKEEDAIQGERIVVFIDEGEVSLHPEWQRNFFKKSTEFLSELFIEKELQLIYITHSPFVLCDIPKENVIFLDKDDEGNAIKSNLEKERTFGANIYSLLADSFFMENGTIGEFAKKNIEWVVEVLDSKNQQLAADTLNKVNYIIDCVGEPLIKQQLEILRSNALNDDKVSALERRIQELENELKKPNDNDKGQ